MIPRWLAYMAGFVVVLGILLFATTGHCVEPSGDAAIAAQIGGLRAEVQGLREQVTRLVTAQERDRERRPAFEADVMSVREAVLSEMRATRADHDARITNLEAARWYVLGAMLVVLAVFGAIWQGWRLDVRRKHENQPPPAQHSGPHNPVGPH